MWASVVFLDTEWGQTVPRKETLNWYEASLSEQERKLRGHFSTPPLLVRKILDACGYVDDVDLSRLKVLDPACGSGNFLVEVASRMLASGQQRGVEPRKILASLQRNLWGFDPDPIACFLAEMQVRSRIAQELLSNRHPSLRLHIHQADGLTLSWEQARQETVDLFIANPPYLAAKNTDLSAYRLTEGLGQVDSYLLFLRLALQVVRPDGWIGLVLPDAVLARANATKERQRLLEEMTVHSLWHLSRVFPAYVGAVVLIAQKRPPQPLHSISWAREKWGTHEKAKLTFTTSFVSQSLLRTQMGAELRYLLGNEQDTLIMRLHTLQIRSPETHAFAPLESLVTLRRGEELGKKSTLLTDARPVEQGWHPLLRGGVDMHAYATPQGQNWIAEAAIEKPLARYATPKLLVVKSTGNLQAALDVQGHVALQTLYLLHANELDTLYFLLALLNSHLLQHYVYVLHTAYKLVQPQIEQRVLAQLPIPLVNSELRQEIIERAKQIMLACSVVSPVVELKQQITLLLKEQERAICTLYENAIVGTDLSRPQA